MSALSVGGEREGQSERIECWVESEKDTVSVMTQAFLESLFERKKIIYPKSQ